MSTAVAEKPVQQTAPPKAAERVPALSPPRLPYHPAVEERFGIDRASWKALVEAIFPNATSVESVILALSYCRARKLDPFKRNVHIVPIWNKELGRMVDTIWPGIGELRTTAFRTGEYAGRDKTEFGPMVTQKVGSVEHTFPDWAQITVYRMVKGQRVAFAGPQVFWLETYATVKRNDDTPNEMWQNRPRGQIDKCAEAAALRAAFPEEIGGDYIAEEVQHTSKGPVVEGRKGPAQSLDDLAERLEGKGEPAPQPQREPGDESDQPADDASQLPSLTTLRDELAAATMIGDVNNIEKKYLDLLTEESDQIEVGIACSDKRNEIKSKRGTGSQVEA
jgi:phage recombination protein Bet